MAILDINTYKEYQNINSDKNDTKIIKTIHSVNAFIASYCNRSFTDYYATDKTEYFDITEKEYYPEEFPLVSITSIKTSANEDGTGRLSTGQEDRISYQLKDRQYKGRAG